MAQRERGPRDQSTGGCWPEWIGWAAGAVGERLDRVQRPSRGVAERVGFEPTDTCVSAVFKTAAIDRSATSPRAILRSAPQPPVGPGGFVEPIEPSDGHHNFVSWLGNGTGERYQQVPGQVDRLWVLDVNGQRLVVDATYSPDTTQADRDQLGQIVESLRFVAR